MESLALEREMKAIELFIKFNQQQQLITAKPLLKKGGMDFWKHNILLVETETVFRVTKGDAAWEDTIAWIFEGQRPFLRQTMFKCNTIAVDFVELVKIAVPNLKCEQG